MNIVRHLLFSIIISLEVVVFYDALNARVDKIACRKCAKLYICFDKQIEHPHISGSNIYSSIFSKIYFDAFYKALKNLLAEDNLVSHLP